MKPRCEGADLRVQCEGGGDSTIGAVKRTGHGLGTARSGEEAYGLAVSGFIQVDGRETGTVE